MSDLLRLTPARLILLTLLVGLVAPAGAVSLSDNLENVTSGSESATAARYLTASFGTGATPFDLGAVTLLLANPTAGSAALDLRADGNLEPGALIAILTSPAGYSSTAAETAFTASGITLSANTTYWIVLRPLSGEFTWAWTADNAGAGVGFQHVWGVSSDSGASWWSFDNYATQFSVTDQVPLTRGDVNCDGAINFFDIDPFLLALFDPPGYAAAHPDCNILTADISNDGAVDFFDIDPFLMCLFGGACP